MYACQTRDLESPFLACSGKMCDIDDRGNRININNMDYCVWIYDIKYKVRRKNCLVIGIRFSLIFRVHMDVGIQWKSAFAQRVCSPDCNKPYTKALSAATSPHLSQRKLFNVDKEKIWKSARFSGRVSRRCIASVCRPSSHPPLATRPSRECPLENVHTRLIFESRIYYIHIIIIIRTHRYEQDDPALNNNNNNIFLTCIMYTVVEFSWEYIQWWRCSRAFALSLCSQLLIFFSYLSLYTPLCITAVCFPRVHNNICVYTCPTSPRHFRSTPQKTALLKRKRTTHIFLVLFLFYFSSRSSLPPLYPLPAFR